MLIGRFHAIEAGEGPALGVHTLLWSDSHANTSRWLDRQTVRDLDQTRIPDADLFVTEIGVFPKLESQYDEIYDEITLAISDLVKDQPHAYDFLRGKTLARSLH